MSLCLVRTTTRGKALPVQPIPRSMLDLHLAKSRLPAAASDRIVGAVIIGNLLVMNADIEAAQALGTARSFIKTNVPSSSGITTLDPQLFTTYIIKFCCSHVKRPLLELRSLVSTEDYIRLKDFIYVESVESLRSFTEFIRHLGVKKIQDWWAYKEMNDWHFARTLGQHSNDDQYR
ncbi:hypothetical protein B0H14DRAFT_1310763 [Mycena olivaceomarginata]|nr:hypothetical protein B0H14DRAFT_1310763 [Mycena olivaceomarginata]